MNEAHYHGRGFAVHCYGTLVPVNNQYDSWKNHIVHTHEPTGQKTATIIVQITPYQQGPEDDQIMQAQAEHAENQQRYREYEEARIYVAHMELVESMACMEQMEQMNQERASRANHMA